MISEGKRSRPRHGQTRSRSGIAVIVVAALAMTSCIGRTRYNEIDGPLKDAVIFPDEFGVDVSGLGGEMAPLLDAVDPSRLRWDVNVVGAERRGVDGSPLDLSAEATQAQHDAALRASQYIGSQFGAAGYAVRYDSVRHRSGAVLPNVSADLPGTTCPGTVFVVGAHYDTENNTTGADDNASAVAGMIELARVMVRSPLPMTVRFIGFPYEEDGRLGSRQVAQRLLEARTDVAGMVSLEMIGYTKPGDDAFLGVPNDYLATVANPPSAYLAQVFGAAHYEYLPNFFAPSAVIDPEVIPDIEGSDHLAFWERGYPALLVTDTAQFRNPNYHTPNDTVDTLDIGFMANSTKATLAGLVALGRLDGNRDGRPDVCATG